MYVLQADTVHRIFPRLTNRFLHILLHLLNNFLNTGRVNPPVGNQQLKRLLCNFSPNGVKAGNHNRLRGVVD